MKSTALALTADNWTSTVPVILEPPVSVDVIVDAPFVKKIVGFASSSPIV